VNVCSASVHDELLELVALGDVLLACEGTFFEVNGSFSVSLMALVTRLRGVQEALGSYGVHHE